MFYRIRKFIRDHDIEDLFVIPYFILSIIIPIFFGLFWFLVWILIHYFLEIYKYYILYNKLTIDSFLIAFDHCIIDFLIFVIALNLESFISIHAAFSSGTMKGLLRSIRFFEIIEFFVKTIGFLKTSKSILHIIKHLKDKSKREFLETPYKYKITKKTKIILFSMILIFLICSSIHIFILKEPVYKLIENYIRTLFH